MRIILTVCCAGLAIALCAACSDDPAGADCRLPDWGGISAISAIGIPLGPPDERDWKCTPDELMRPDPPIPNPLVDCTQLEVEMRSQGFLAAIVLDSCGAALDTLIADWLEAGRHRLELCRGDLPRGLYRVQYQVQFGEQNARSYGDIRVEGE